MARDAVKPNTIYALEKADMIEMVKIEFNTRKELKQAATKYIKSGFKVHYVMS
jgi:hypothetical protein